MHFLKVINKTYVAPQLMSPKRKISKMRIIKSHASLLKKKKKEREMII